MLPRPTNHFANDRREISTLEGKLDEQSRKYDSAFRQLEQVREQTQQKQKELEHAQSEAAASSSVAAEPSAKQLKELKQLRAENQELRSQLETHQPEPNAEKYEETGGFKQLRAKFFDSEIARVRKQNNTQAQELTEENGRLRKQVAAMDASLARTREQLHQRNAHMHSLENSRAKQHFRHQQSLSSQQQECEVLKEQLKLLRYQIEKDNGLRKLLASAKNELMRKEKQINLEFTRKQEKMMKKCNTLEHEQTILREKLRRQTELARFACLPHENYCCVYADLRVSWFTHHDHSQCTTSIYITRWDIWLLPTTWHFNYNLSHTFLVPRHALLVKPVVWQRRASL